MRVRWTAMLAGLALGAVAVQVERAWAGCSQEERDDKGNCPSSPSKPAATAPKSTSTRTVAVSGQWGGLADVGCADGLLVESGHCCWPGQGWSGSACVGPPSCPGELVAAGDRCTCPAGEKMMSGHCCWPGQAWSSSAEACVGTASCPSGFQAWGDGCRSSAEIAEEAAAARAEAARREAAARAEAARREAARREAEEKAAALAAAMEAVRGAQAGTAYASPTLGTMKWIPAGTFQMGSASGVGDDDEHPQHSVTLSRGFWLMEHEVTQGEWVAVMGRNPSQLSSCGSDCPVEMVSWDEAMEFARQVSAREGVEYRLPTEAEWEYAAPGGQGYTYAGSENLDAVGWYSGNSGNSTHPVCQKQRNGYGLCDMSGNVGEWVRDWYGDYSSLSNRKDGATTDPTGASSGADRVYRGGSWGHGAANARVAARNRLDPSFRYYFLGFRLARSVP